jgi:hypothetical protein
VINQIITLHHHHHHYPNYNHIKQNKQIKLFSSPELIFSTLPQAIKLHIFNNELIFSFAVDKRIT